MPVEPLLAAKYKLIMTKPYLAHALLSLIPVKTDRIPTLAVDKRWRLYYNPKLFENITITQAASCLEHELWHLLRRHFERFPNPGEDRALVNDAEDLEINDDLHDLPDWTLHPTQYGLPVNLLAEEYYERLKKMIQQQGKQGGGGTHSNQALPSGNNCGSGARGDMQEWESDEGPGVTTVQQEAIISDTAEQVARWGKAPAGEKLWAEEILKPKPVPWQQILMRYVRHAEHRAGNGEYIYTRPNRRFMHMRPFIYPSVRSRIFRIAAVIDTSGSMQYQQRMLRAMAQAEDLLTSSGRELMVICCDAAAYKPQRVTSVKQVDLEGGGGTDMRVGIDEAIKLKSDVVVVFTDGETPLPDAPSKTTVIACLVSDTQYAREAVPSWMPKVVVPSHE